MTDDLQRELARTRAALEASEHRLRTLRGGKAVRAALALAALRPGARSGPPPPAAAVEPEPAVSDPVGPPDPSAAVPSQDVVMMFPPGHFYSPVPDTGVLAGEASARVWRAAPREAVGVDWRGPQQLEQLRTLGKLSPFALPDSDPDPAVYSLDNDLFNVCDAWFLQGMLRTLQPRRMIEVGCGMSSLLTARVNRECLGGRLDFTCVEPYPAGFLKDGVEGISRLIVEPVQDVGPDVFGTLEAGDVLFIDTSHTVKTGNDVVYLFQEVVPRVAPGVVIHVHDMFMPHEYPRDWVLAGRGWNEQYLVQAFLAFNRSFEVLISVAWLHHFEWAALAEAAGGAVASTGGGSLWLRRSE